MSKGIERVLKEFGKLFGSKKKAHDYQTQNMKKRQSLWTVKQFWEWFYLGLWNHSLKRKENSLSYQFKKICLFQFGSTLLHTKSPISWKNFLDFNKLRPSQSMMIFFKGAPSATIYILPKQWKFKKMMNQWVNQSSNTTEWKNNLLQRACLWK